MTVVLGGCGVAFPAAATVLFPICFALLAAAASALPTVAAEADAV